MNRHTTTAALALVLAGLVTPAIAEAQIPPAGSAARRASRAVEREVNDKRVIRRLYELHYLNIWRGSGILYVAGERVAQVPNFQHPVGSTAIEFEVNANRNLSAYIRDIRVDYGVDDPYETFLADGAYTTRSIFFDFNSDDLRPESTPELERIRAMLDANSSLTKVVITGHTDSIGEDAYNMELSGRRAEAVKRHLVENGIDAGRIDTAGAGESDPVAGNDTDEGRQENRRVVISVPS